MQIHSRILYVLYVIRSPLDKPKGATQNIDFKSFLNRFAYKFYTFYTFCHNFESEL